MTDPQERTEDLAQLLARLKAERNLSDTAIARRIGVAPATVNAWVHRKRGTGRGPAQKNLEALAREFNLDRDAVFRAADRTSPGPLDAEAEARVLELYRALTEEQRRMKEIEMRALGEMNRTGQ